MGRKLPTTATCFLLIIALVTVIDFGFEVAPLVKGKTITVGHQEDYPTIQQGIDAAEDGDTVYVFAGMYYENIMLNKSINLTGEDRISTTIDGSLGWDKDVVTINANWVNITEFTIRLSTRAGIRIKSNHNAIINNDLESTSEGSIYLESSRGNNISGNAMRKDGIVLFGNQINHWNTHNIDSTNTLNDKPVYYLKDQEGGKIPTDAGQVLLANSTNLIIEDLDLQNTTVGIELGFSSNNTIRDNEFKQSWDGIYLYNSNKNHISHNTVTYYNHYGIHVHYSSENIIDNNMVSLCYDFGIRLEHSHMNSISSNLVTPGNGEGISLESSTGNEIVNNNVSDNYGNIYVWNSDTNNIIGNYISFSNMYGLYIRDSSSNNIYHNNIIDNYFQAADMAHDNQWDNGYPSGGNYWSDFDESSEGAYDDYNGPGQNISGSDGVVDNGTDAGGGMNPYYIDSYSKDNYPLITPFVNSLFLFEGWNMISIPLIQSNTSLNSVLHDIKSDYDAVQWYNIKDTNDPWKHHIVDKPFGNDLLELNETMGFWIHITQPGDTIFLYNGTQPTQNQTIQLYSGWNMVGYPSLTSFNRTDGLNNLTFDDQVDAIWSYDASTQKWEKMGESDYFQIGRGYYIHAKSECEWEVPL